MLYMYLYNIAEETKTTKYFDFMKQRYPPNFTYQDFARDFTAEFFNASEWAELSIRCKIYCIDKQTS